MYVCYVYNPQLRESLGLLKLLYVIYDIVICSRSRKFCRMQRLQLKACRNERRGNCYNVSLGQFCCTCIFLQQFQLSGHLFLAFSAYTVNCYPLSESDFSIPLDHVVRPHLIHWLAFREAATANVMQTLERKLFTYCNHTRCIEKPPLHTLVVSSDVAWERQVWKCDSGEKKETCGYNRHTLKAKVKIQLQYCIFHKSVFLPRWLGHTIVGNSVPLEENVSLKFYTIVTN